jgi:hypothetical protein
MSPGGPSGQPVPMPPSAGSGRAQYLLRLPSSLARPARRQGEYDVGTIQRDSLRMSGDDATSHATTLGFTDNTTP